MRWLEHPFSAPITVYLFRRQVWLHSEKFANRVNRTPNLVFRRHTLYPIELYSHNLQVTGLEPAFSTPVTDTSSAN